MSATASAVAGPAIDGNGPTEADVLALVLFVLAGVLLCGFCCAFYFRLAKRGSGDGVRKVDVRPTETTNTLTSIGEVDVAVDGDDDDDDDYLGDLERGTRGAVAAGSPKREPSASPDARASMKKKRRAAMRKISAMNAMSWPERGNSRSSRYALESSVRQEGKMDAVESTSR